MLKRKKRTDTAAASTATNSDRLLLRCRICHAPFVIDKPEDWGVMQVHLLEKHAPERASAGYIMASYVDTCLFYGSDAASSGNFERNREAILVHNLSLVAAIMKALTDTQTPIAIINGDDPMRIGGQTMIRCKECKAWNYPALPGQPANCFTCQTPIPYTLAIGEQHKQADSSHSESAIK